MKRLLTIFLVLLAFAGKAQISDAKIADTIALWVVPNSSKSITAAMMNAILDHLNNSKINKDSLIVTTSGDSLFVTYGTTVDTIIGGGANHWTKTGNDITNNNTGNTTVDSALLVPRPYVDTKVAYVMGWLPATGNLYPIGLSTLYDSTQQAVMSTPSVYTTWVKDTANGELYPATLTDKVGIGVNNPNKTLDVTGDVEVVADVTSTGGGLTSAFRLQTNALKSATGNQWGGLYSTMFTVAGNDTLQQLNAILTNLTHSNGFDLPLYEGFESGEGAISGAGTTIQRFYGYEAKTPQVTDGAAIDTAAAIHIAGSGTTGITNPFALLSELAAPSQFTGSLKIMPGSRTYLSNDVWVGDSVDHVANSTLILGDYGGRNFALTSGYTTNGQFEIFRMLNDMTKSTVYFTITSGGLVGINSTAPDKMLEINSSTGANLRLTYNDNSGSAANYSDFAMSSSGDLTITPSGGGLVYGDTFWRDATVSALSLAGGVQAPTLTAVIGGIMAQGFNYQTANDIAYGQVQLNHDYKLATDIEAHCHWSINTSPAPGSDTVVIAFEYAWADINEAIPTSDTAIVKIATTTIGGGKHALTELVSAITGAGGDGLSSVIWFRIERLQNDGSDTYNGWWLLHDVDFHMQIDSPGSEGETTK